jgi:transposase-like protein
VIKDNRGEIEGMEGARRATGIPSRERSETSGAIRALPDPEICEKATRRRFTARYKLRILNLADSCTSPGSLGALLRREGIYHSNLKTWSRQRDRGVLSGLEPRKRGRKVTAHNPLQGEIERLHKENDRLRKRLRQAEIIIDVQKKASEMVGIALETIEAGEKS